MKVKVTWYITFASNTRKMLSEYNLIWSIHTHENAAVKIFYAYIVFGEIQFKWLKKILIYSHPN